MIPLYPNYKESDVIEKDDSDTSSVEGAGGSDKNMKLFDHIKLQIIKCKAQGKVRDLDDFIPIEYSYVGQTNFFHSKFVFRHPEEINNIIKSLVATDDTGFDITAYNSELRI